LICYDLRFPVWSRNRGDYDLLLYVANWPAVRAAAWRSLLTARAIENQAFTIGVNRVGTDDNGHGYAGDSGLIDYRGDWRVQLSGHEAVHTLAVELEEQRAFRARYAFLDDRDEFSLIS
jgi:predicted amidohydrolase